MAKGDALRDRTTTAIIESAAALLAERPETSVEEIADAAGIGRATLYRYFATRDHLLSAVAARGVQELAARIREAGLDAVPFDEAIARLTRAIIITGSKYVALNRDGGRHSQAYPGLEAEVMKPIRAVFRRAIADGSLRKGLRPDLLMSLYSGLVRGALEPGGSWRGGMEQTVEAVTTLFLRGVRA